MKKIIIGAVVLVVLATIGWTIYPKPKVEILQLTQVKRGDLKSIVSSSGALAGKDTVNLKFKTSGRLSYINVKQGDSVIAGQVIAGLDTQDLSIALQQAYNTLRYKQANIEKVLDDVKNHDKDETFTQKQTRTLAEVERDNAFDSVKAARRDFQDTVVISPIEGIITQADPVSGQTVGASDVIAQVVNIKDLFFDAEIDEADIAKISIEQKAEIILDAYPDQVFKGIVEEILPQTITSSTGATTIKIRINIGQPKIKFISGLSGQVVIILAEAKNVLTVPQESVNEDNTVFIGTKGGIKPVKVITGIKSDTEVEIKEGLTENDRVVKNPSSIQNRRG